MPFTPTHVLAVLPFAFALRWMPISALAIGAMVPDAPMFFPGLKYAQTHSIVGVFNACLPLGVAAFLLFQWVLKEPLAALLPVWVQQRTTSVSKPFLVPTVSFLMGVTLAVLIGSFSHLLWDSFSHQGRWGTQLVPDLNHLISIGPWALPGYKVIQYGSTIVGLPLLVLITGATLAMTEPSDESLFPNVDWRLKRLAFAICLIVPLLIAMYAWMAKDTIYEVLGTTIKKSGAIFLAGMLIYSLLFQAFVSRKRYIDFG
ncbi:MAG: DUF4184 family protein [Planctomycetales bacterium]|nr:DUF4184 family protein [Planctomycetales bacterium]